MQPRICIAMALSAEPDLLTADAPLNATLQVEAIELLKKLQCEAGCVALFTFHHFPFSAPPAVAARKRCRRPIPILIPNARVIRIPFSGEAPSLPDRLAGCKLHSRATSGSCLARRSSLTQGERKPARFHSPHLRSVSLSSAGLTG
jgi:hypothetical protein